MHERKGGASAQCECALTTQRAADAQEVYQPDTGKHITGQGPGGYSRKSDCDVRDLSQEHSDVRSAKVAKRHRPTTE